MKNKSNRKFKNRISRKKLKKMINDKSQLKNFEKIIKEGLGDGDFELLMDVFRESRMDTLFDELNIDKEKMAKAKKKLVKLNPKSSKCPLISTLYKDHKGKYKVETLIKEYHDSTIRDGITFGITYGKKFIVEDIQNNRFSKEDILNMSQEELFDYCDENWERI